MNQQMNHTSPLHITFILFGFLGLILLEILLLLLSNQYGTSYLVLGIFAAIALAFLLMNPFYSMMFNLFVLFCGLGLGFSIPYGFFAVVAITGLAWIVDQTVHMKFSIRWDGQFLLVLALLSVMLLSGLFGYDLKVTLASLLYFMKLALFYFLIIQLVQSKTHLKMAVFIMIAATFTSLLAGILGYFTPLPFLGQGDQGFRLRGFTGQPNVLALHILIIFPILVLYLFRGANTYLKGLMGALVFLALLGLLGTFSRAGLLGLGAVILGVLFVLRSNRWLLFTALLAFVIILFLIPDIIWERILSVKDIAQDPSLRWRAKAWIGAFDLFLKNPILGIGMGNFVFVSHTIVSIHMSAHNTFLELAAETGIVGLGIFLGFFLSNLYHLYHSQKIFFKLNEKELGTFCQALLVSVSGIVVFSIFHSIQAYFVYWALVALGASFYLYARQLEASRELAGNNEPV